LRDGTQSVQGIAAPLKAFAQRFAFLGLVVTAFGIMLLGKADTILVERLRIFVADALTPVLGLVSQPAGALADAIENLRELATLRAENERLKAENEKLLDWLARARQLEAENRQLRELLSFVPEQRASQTTARVIAESDGPFVKSLLVNAGGRDGVRRGQAAVTGAGLVGRVAEVGARSARVLLITDLNSRVPVLLESTRTRAVLAGDNQDRPSLQHLPPNATPTPGERIVTSGDGGVFSPGLPVGVVAASADGGIRVQPFVELGRLEYLRLMEFGLRGVLWPDRRSAGLGGPP
jgi:rod shape-determining protein MreC